MIPSTLPRLTLVLGGARSGKSAYAERRIMTGPAPWVYIATADAYDDEMRHRISEHQARRDRRWQSLDAPLDLADALAAPAAAGKPVLVDCLTLWLSNVMLAERDVAASSAGLVEILSAAAGPLVLVTNEVGLGIVPDNALARRFRDAQGRLNQDIAAIADEVVFVAAGIPLVMKSTRIPEAPTA